MLRAHLVALSFLVVACGVVEAPSQAVGTHQSALASTAPDCQREQAAYDEAYEKLWNCTSRQLEDPTVNCRAEVIQLQLENWNLAYCKAGQTKRLRCACEIPEVSRDGGRMFQCNGPDGGCLKTDGGVVDAGAPLAL